MKGKILLALAAFLCLTGVACDLGSNPSHPENPALPNQGPTKRADSEPMPTVTPHPQPDPSAMASAESNPNFVVLKLIADTEFGGKIEYIVNSGAPQTIEIKKEQLFRDPDGTFYVFWHLPVIAENGLNYGFTWYPKSFGGRAFCLLYAKGKMEDYQIVQRGQCAVSHTIPVGG